MAHAGALTTRFQALRIVVIMPKCILSVSYDASLLATRELLLKMNGYDVTSALGFSRAIAHCHAGSFELFILGHSIPQDDKLELIKIFRQNCIAPILSLDHFAEDTVPSDFHASPDNPERLLKTVDQILGGSRDVVQPAESGGKTLIT